MLREGDFGRRVDCKCMFAPLCLRSGTETLAKKKAESWRAERLPEKYISQKSQASMSEQWKISWAFRVVGEARFWFSTSATINWNIPALICLLIILLMPLSSYFTRNGTIAITKLALSRRLMLRTLQGENRLSTCFLMVTWWILLSSMLWSSFTLWTSLTFMGIMFSGLWCEFRAFLLLPLNKCCTIWPVGSKAVKLKGVRVEFHVVTFNLHIVFRCQCGSLGAASCSDVHSL